MMPFPAAAMIPLGPGGQAVPGDYQVNQPLKLSTQPGYGSLQAAETMLGLMMATGRPEVEVESRPSASAWGGAGGLEPGTYLGECVGVGAVTDHLTGYLRTVEYVWIHPLRGWIEDDMEERRATWQSSIIPLGFPGAG